jgi:hypothetical protein
MNKLTIEDLKKMTVSSLEKFLNEAIKDVVYANVERRYVRDKMIKELEKHLHKSVELHSGKTDDSYINISTKRYGIGINVTTKATGKTEQVTRLKRKDVCAPGKFKVNEIYGGYSIPSFEIDDISKYSVKIDGSYCPESVAIPKSNN